MQRGQGEVPSLVKVAKIDRKVINVKKDLFYIHGDGQVKRELGEFIK